MLRAFFSFSEHPTSLRLRLRLGSFPSPRIPPPPPDLRLCLGRWSSASGISVSFPSGTRLPAADRALSCRWPLGREGDLGGFGRGRRRGEEGEACCIFSLFLGDFRLDVEAEKEEEQERDEGEEGEDGSLLFCFWVYLLKSATFPCTIFRQVNSDVKDAFPILVLNGDKRLTLLPPLPPQKEYPDSEVSPFSSEKLYASSDSEFPFGKWVHVGCQVSSELLRLHIDGEVADEKPLSASKDGESSPLRKISLVSTSGTDDGIEGYLYSPKVLHPSSSIEDHYKDSPVHLAIDKSSASDIEEVSDGIWSIVGGKAKDSFRTCPDVILKNIETAEKLFSDSECTKMRNSNSKSMPSVGKAVPDSFTFSYCLAGPHERALLLKKFAASASDEEVLELANQVSLCTGCSHHWNQIAVAKKLIEEGTKLWSLLSQNDSQGERHL